jgi:hypothetical protein
MTSSCIPLSSEFQRKVDAFLINRRASVASVSNLATHIDKIGEGNGRIPITINHGEPQNTWVCSPHVTYARYSIEEIERWGHSWLARPLAAVCRGLGTYMRRARIDDTAIVNNWLLSTNLYPSLDRKALGSWITEALDRWPRHSLWFRSLNRRYTPDWLEALERAGFVLIPSRQVYLYDRIDLEARTPANLHRDLKLLGATKLVRSGGNEWQQHDFERAARLYQQLYLEKYSPLNPDYGPSFLQTWHEAGLLELTGLRDVHGDLQGVIGLFALGDTITAPIVGYATERSPQEGLYRQLMALVYEHAALRRGRINLSAGAAEFKRLRGGIATMEYSAVYVRHLPAAQGRAVRLLSLLARRIGEPCMRRFKL